MTATQKPLSCCNLSQQNNLQSVLKLWKPVSRNHFKSILDLQLEILAPEKFKIIYDCCNIYCHLVYLVWFCTF